MPLSDRHALPELIDAMEVAGYHDAERCTRSLLAAEAFLGERFHQSRQAVQGARDAVDQRDFRAVWRWSHIATHTLTWAYPPDSSTCPPYPDDAPFSAATACACGVQLPDVARFCAMCGTPRPDQEQ